MASRLVGKAQMRRAAAQMGGPAASCSGTNAILAKIRKNSGKKVDVQIAKPFREDCRARVGTPHSNSECGITPCTRGVLRPPQVHGGQALAKR
jgi:hypothetical protein